MGSTERRDDLIDSVGMGDGLMGRGVKELTYGADQLYTMVLTGTLPESLTSASMRAMDRERRQAVLHGGTLESLNEDLLYYLRVVYNGGCDRPILGLESMEELFRLVDGQRGVLYEKSAHETVIWPIAQAMARSLEEILRDKTNLQPINGIYGGIDSNVGMGSIMAALNEVRALDVRVGIESNPKILSQSKMVMKILERDFSSTVFVCMDAWDFPEKYADSIREEINFVVVDPEWAKYESMNGEIKPGCPQYDFSMMDPSGDKIVERWLDFIPVVALKIPGNFNEDEAIELADRLGAKCHVRMFEYRLDGRIIREGLAVFVKNNVHQGVEKFTKKIQQLE